MTRFRGTLVALLAALLLHAACSEKGPPSGVQPSPTPTSVRLNETAVTLDDGASVQLTATVLDQNGQAVAGASISWSSNRESVASVSAGQVTGNSPGEADVSARSGNLSASAKVTVKPVPSTIEKIGGDAQEGNTGEVLSDSLVVRVLDRHGNGVAGVEVGFGVTGGGGSISPTITQTDAQGRARAAWTLGLVEGANTASASVSGLSGSPLAFSSTGRPAGPRLGPVITAVAPDLLTPGAAATLTGENFSTATGGNTVTVDGVAVNVSAASATQLSITLPDAAAFTCQPTAEVEVAVEVAGERGIRRHPLRIAHPRSLGVGESLTLLDAADVRCNELAQSGGRYTISVFHTGTAAGASSAFQLRGASLDPVAPSAPVRSTAPAVRTPRPDHGRTDATGLSPNEEQHATRAHLRLLEQNRRLVERLGPPPRTRDVGRVAAAAARLRSDPPRVGDTLTLRIPDIRSANACTNFIEVTARAVYSGTRSVVLEDTAAPLAGTMDTLYAQLGQEFDTRMFPILEANFGDPFAFDASSAVPDRILMVFSKTVNDFGSVAGFVFSGDYYARSQCASSDQTRIFYAVLPTSSADGFAAGTRAQWLRTMRSTAHHEGKHVASFSERFARNASVLEESWLEEATARIAEELYGREVFGYSQKGNTGYQASIFCEMRPTNAACAGRPLVMFKHFSALYDYYSSVETLTPLGPATPEDFTFYASGWLLVRWAIDHYAASEPAMLRALTQEAQLSGVANLTARTGRGFPELLAAWSLAAAVDDAGVAVSRSELTLPSWNTRDVFARLNTDFPTTFTRVFPLAVRAIGFGAFQVEVPQLRAGSAAIFELSGTQAAPQVLELQGAGGGAPAATLRIAILRTQ